MAFSDVSPPKLPGPPRTKIVEENIDTVRKQVEEKANSSLFLLTPTSGAIVNTAASLNKNQIITAVNDILPRAQACI